MTKLKKLILKWRHRPGNIGEIKVTPEIYRLFKLGQCYGVAPALRLDRNKNGELVNIELLHLSLIPKDNIPANKLNLTEVMAL